MTDPPQTPRELPTDLEVSGKVQDITRHFADRTKWLVSYARAPEDAYGDQ